MDLTSGAIIGFCSGIISGAVLTLIGEVIKRKLHSIRGIKIAITTAIKEYWLLLEELVRVNEDILFLLSLSLNERKEWKGKESLGYKVHRFEVVIDDLKATNKANKAILEDAKFNSYRKDFHFERIEEVLGLICNEKGLIIDFARTEKAKERLIEINELAKPYFMQYRIKVRKYWHQNKE